MAVIERTRQVFTLDDQAADRYPCLPFVLRNQDSFEVKLRYDRSSAVIDLGCEGPDGWVGWSGGARDSFVVTRDAATPGYRPGTGPGRWHVVLGLHKLPVEGALVEVEVMAPATRPVDEGGVLGDHAGWPVPPDSPRASGRRLPADEGLTWYAGDLHSHTVHSDGTSQVAELAAAAASNRLDFLAVTDHNTTSHFPHLPGVSDAYGIALIPGQEVTTHRGHANAFGEIGFVDFRRPAAEWLDAVDGAGGLMSINHPLQDDCAWQHSVPRRPSLLEFWHVSWFLDLTNTAPWAWWNLARGGLDDGLGQRPGPVIVGGSDFHTPAQGYPPGTPTTWVAAAEPTPEAILEGIRKGRTAISRSPGVGEPALVRTGGELVAIDAAGCVLVDLEGRRTVIRSDRWAIPERADLHRIEAPDRSVLAVC
ncbi:hypothetical protein GCM10009785_23270 [Brooklawnia cerclae]|uniref:Polymerase/histidinol phosphatase N-terminal domain-containing protein n=1 Tax=Brooklawnia cerclae TaxID=349934 RepID=A0ABX0SI90_9ACTN|nr:hypothetical protein [Brooklawnia cerclae]